LTYLSVSSRNFEIRGSFVADFLKFVRRPALSLIASYTYLVASMIEIIEEIMPRTRLASPTPDILRVLELI
jgi:hypothetical protein